jgi:gliding motility-associated-like protein
MIYPLKMKQKLKLTFLFIISTWLVFFAEAQPCTTLGQTPSTAFPVCGTTTFQQATVPICSTNNLYVPGCSGDGADYENKNPFFYKFTCYVSGTLGFVITPLANQEDYDWQLYDITGKNPDAIFTDRTIIVTGNWAGTYGATGASASGVNYIQCASDPNDNRPTFAKMPVLTAGHEYLLMISHFTNTQSGYTLSFGGGTAVITDPKVPGMLSAKPDCDGKLITLKVNKKIRCNSLTATGSEFRLAPAATVVTAAATSSCTNSFEFDELTLTLATALPNGTYDLIINNGTDANTLLDICGTGIATGEKVSFTYAAPQPIFADSIGKPACAPDSVKVYFPKKISCSSIAANGSDFSVTGPTPVTVISAGGNCINDKTDYVVVKFAAPINTRGNYLLTLKAGSDGTVLIDEFGQETPVHTLPFTTADTVSADFTYTEKLGCQRDTLTFTHNGANDVNFWSWTFNNSTPVTTQTHTIIFPATSSNNIQLLVSNGVCSDTAAVTIELDNEVKADFTMPSFICPEDKLELVNTSKGQIDNWKWNFDLIASSTLKDPLPVQFPTINREAYYTVKLVAFNNTLGCTDSMRRTLTVLDHCLIAVPTAFTPNNDGRNDFFRPHNALKADNYEFHVYNRWGQLIFQSKNWQEKWDGKLNGVLQPAAVYVWMLRYNDRTTKQPVFKKGTVTLIR